MKRNDSACSVYGRLMLLVGVLVAVPLTVLPFYPGEANYAPSFLLPALGSLLLGAVVFLSGKQDGDGGFEWQTTQQRSSLTVLSAWLWGIAVGAVPFLLGGRLSCLQALFESVSGWTTTGLSVLDVRNTPHIYLFHRSFMQFCGGLGFVMMMVMLVIGKQSMTLYNAEGHPDKLMPNLKRTAQTIFSMYSGFLAVGTAAYRIAGMKLFDSILHAMCALSTGGFSTRLNSIGDYNSPAIELVTLVLMLIGTTNFAVLLLFTKRKWRQALLNIRRRISPSRKIEAPFYMKAQGKTPLDPALAADTTGFVVCYLTLFMIGALLITVTADCILTEGVFEFASALGTVGLSIGITGPATGTGTLIVEMFGMLFGRLEIFIILVGIYSGISRIRRK